MLDHLVSKAPLKLPNMNFGPLKMGYVEQLSLALRFWRKHPGKP